LRAGEILDYPVKFAIPMIYAAIILVTASLVLQVTLLAVYASPLPGVSFYVAPVLAWSTLYGLVSWALLRLEGLRRPGGIDHLRRCALLYASLVVLGCLLLYTSYGGTVDVGPAFMIAAPFCIVNAILMDAGVLLLKRWRFGRIRSRSLS
jgi:hypothetical protein